MGVARIPFDAMDESRIASAASWGIITAVTSLASVAITAVITVPGLVAMSAGPLMGLMGTIALAATVGVIAITVLLDVWLIQASLAFRKVAVTDVADQHYLIEGFAKLRNYFLVMGVMLILATLLAAVSMFLTCVG
jgi:hypothetical protein